MGHQDQFPPSSVSGGCRLGQATFAGTDGKEREAPFAVVRGAEIEWPKSTRSGHSLGSFNHLGGAGKDQWRHGQAERLGGLEVQDHLELGRELHRKIARLLAA